MFTKNETDQIERLALIIILGLSRALEQEIISNDESENLLFTPHTIGVLNEIGVSKDVVHLIELGLELDDIKTVVPNHYKEVIHRIEKDASNILKTRPPHSFSQDKWLEILIRKTIENHDSADE